VVFSVNGVEQPPPSELDSPDIHFTVPVGVSALNIQVTVTDNVGRTATDSLTKTVNPDPSPTVNITSPTVGAMVTEGKIITISADASDNGSVVSVLFAVDGVPQSTITVPPYSLLYTVSLGITSITINATVTDNLGKTASDTRTVSVIAGLAPTVSVNRPIEGSPLYEGQTFTIQVDATDDEVVKSVDILINGGTFATFSSGPPYELLFTVPYGSNTLTFGATAQDFQGRIGTATDVSVFVDPDPLTTIEGRVVDSSGIPVAGADVSVQLNGLLGEFFDFNTPLNTFPDLTGLTPDVTKIISTVNFLNPGELLSGDTFGVGMGPDFAARLTGLININMPENYSFELGSDDGARLFINGNLVVEVIGSGDFAVNSGLINLSAGTFPIQIEYFQAVGDAEIQLIFGIDDQFSQILPPSNLTVDPSPYTAVSDSNGLFSIPGVPAHFGAIQVNALANVGGEDLAGSSGLIAPVPNGVTNVGDISLSDLRILQDIGTLGGPFGFAYSINDNEQVVGESLTAVFDNHAFLWDAVGGLQDLGTLGGSLSVANDINNSAQVAGLSQTASFESHAFLWDSIGGMQDLGTLGGVFSAALGINDVGQVVGRAAGATGDIHAFMWDSVNGMQDLGTLGGTESTASAINTAGQVVGDSETAAGEFHAFLWDPVGGMLDLGTLGGTFSSAYGINDLGQVVGESETATGEFHAFIWDSVNGMQDLGTLGGTTSTASDINDSGQVVGTSEVAGFEFHAFLWDAVAGLQDLGTLGGLQSSANGINSSGQAVGGSETATGEFHPFLF